MTAALASCDIHPAAFYEADKRSDPSASGAMFVEAERREDKELKGHTDKRVTLFVYDPSNDTTQGGAAECGELTRRSGGRLVGTDAT